MHAIKTTDPLEKATIVLKITSLNQELDIQKVKVIYTYTDGTSQEELFKDQNIIPEPSNKSDWFFKLWCIVIPVLAILVIAIIPILRKFK